MATAEQDILRRVDKVEVRLDGHDRTLRDIDVRCAGREVSYCHLAEKVDGLAKAINDWKEKPAKLVTTIGTAVVQTLVIGFVMWLLSKG